MVYDTSKLFGEKGKFRVLQFSDEAVQGAVDLNRPERILFEYPRAVIHLMEYNRPSFEHVFIIGHGIGTIAGHFPDKLVKTAELSEKIVELSKTFFGYRWDNVMIGDGLRLLEREKPNLYDYIILDAFTKDGTPRHFMSRHFFRITRDKLHSEGAVILNLIGRGANDECLRAVHTTLREEYAYTKTFSFSSDKAHDYKNILMIGSSSPIRFQERKMAGFIEIGLEQGHILGTGHAYNRMPDAACGGTGFCRCESLGNRRAGSTCGTVNRNGSKGR